MNKSNALSCHLYESVSPFFCHHYPFHFLVLVKSPLFNQTVRSFAISAKLIKELREMTSAPMLDCKKALESPEVNGDLNKAVDYLRKQGLKKVTKVEKRNASQGVIASCIKDNKGVLIEVYFVVVRIYCFYS